MKKNIDILLDEDGDLMLDVDGEPVVGDVTQQNVELILKTTPGDLKLSPMFGVGIKYHLHGNNYNRLRLKIKQNLEADGMRVNNLIVNDEKIIIDAEYK